MMLLEAGARLTMEAVVRLTTNWSVRDVVVMILNISYRAEAQHQTCSVLCGFYSPYYVYHTLH